MSKVYFESEQEAREFLKDTLCEYYKEKYPSPMQGYDINKTIKETVFRAKQKGYIKRSAVEEANEIIRTTVGYSDTARLAWSDFLVIKDAIQELKAEIERLKC